MSVITFQQQMLHDIVNLEADSTFEHAGLAIYRNNLCANAARSLGLSFPAVKQLLEQENFQLATNKYLTKVPRVAADWAEFGHLFPSFLATLSLINELPYLAELAQVELRIHQAIHSTNQPVNMESFQQLADENSELLTLTLASGMSLMQSRFPLIDIRQFFLSDSDAPSSTFDDCIRHALESRVSLSAFNILIYRQGFEVKVEYVSDDEARWYQLLIDSTPMGAALTEMDDTSFQFEQWLPAAIAQQKVIGVT